MKYFYKDTKVLLVNKTFLQIYKSFVYKLNIFTFYLLLSIYHKLYYYG
jgi:hypothetical protein